LREVRGAIAIALAKVSSEDKTNEIWKIVDKSCSLALDFGIQRFRIQLSAPRENKTISLGSAPGTIVDLNKSNNSASGGVVLLVVKPGLRKLGDGRGGSWGTVTTLLPSEVYLEKPRI
jgi:hypothetical protein